MNPEKKKYESDLRSAWCPICGKEFFPTPEHVYRDGRLKYARPVCSYHCALESERQAAEKKRRYKGARGARHERDK